MSAMEEKLRGVTKRGSRHGPRATGPAASDWPAAPGSGGGGRGQAAPSSSQPGGSAHNRGHESPSRRQSSRESVEPTGQQAPPEHGELLFKVLPSLLIHVIILSRKGKKRIGGIGIAFFRANPYGKPR